MHAVPSLRSDQSKPPLGGRFDHRVFALSAHSCFNVLQAVKSETEGLRQREISPTTCSFSAVYI